MTTKDSISNFNLKDYNTFGIEVRSREFVRVTSVSDLKELYRSDIFKKRHLILGGGSNILFTNDFEGTVLKMEISGIELKEDNPDYVLIEAGAGENWHKFVLFCIENDWAGIENLSLIPGTVGAAPMQNIGAYGVEIKEVFHSLNAFNKESGELETFSKEDCEFGYRSSVFKTSKKDKYIITTVSFRLKKSPELNMSYGAIKSTLEEMGIFAPGIRDVSKAVIHIRQSKLPDPSKIGNAGSFFKNPVIEKTHFDRLKKRYQDIPSYPVDDEFVKVPAGWLIEKSGWKGKSYKSTGVHNKQALVLINPGNADGSDVHELSKVIYEDIKKQFGIELETEVNII